MHHSVYRAVSASDQRKYNAQEPLQDNVLIVLEAIILRAPVVGRWLAEPGVEILQKLVALIALFVSVLGDQVRCSVSLTASIEMLIITVHGCAWASCLLVP